MIIRNVAGEGEGQDFGVIRRDYLSPLLFPFSDVLFGVGGVTWIQRATDAR